MAPSHSLDVVEGEHPDVEDGKTFDETHVLIQKEKTTDTTLQKCTEDTDAENRTLRSRIACSLKRFVSFYVDNYVLLIITAAVGTALNNASIKILSEKNSVMGIVAARSSFCVFVLFGLCRWKNISLNDYRSEISLIAMRGILGAASFLCHAMAMFMLPLSESAFMINSHPVMTAVLSSLFGMERLGIPAWIGAIGCLIGNALVAHPPFLFGGHEDWGSQRIMGVLFAISGTIFMSCMFIILKRLGKNVSTVVLTLSMQMCSCLFSLPFVFIGYPKAVGLSGSWLLIIPFLMTLVSGIPIQCALSRAFQIGPPSKVTAILMMNMPLSAAIGVLALSEKMSWFAAVGAAVILLSVLLVQTPDGSKNKNNQYQKIPTTDVKKTVELSVQGEP